MHFVDPRWQQYSTHLHTSSTQNTENGTHITIRDKNNNVNSKWCTVERGIRFYQSVVFSHITLHEQMICRALSFALLVFSVVQAQYRLSTACVHCSSGSVQT
jgi:hypothetical protein